MENLNPPSDIVKELKTFQKESKTLKNSDTLSEEELNDYILRKGKLLIDLGLDSIEDVKDAITSAQDAEELTALSKLIGSVSTAIEAINKINLLNKKGKLDKESQERDIEGKKELMDHAAQQGFRAIEHKNQTNNITIHNNTTTTHQKAVVVASREEVLKKLVKEALSNDFVPQLEESLNAEPIIEAEVIREENAYSPVDLDIKPR